eukprot:TRINITY_DN1548_c0_g1_i5.p3 TRINITY_DN1548_c0_g1~~TRINITY_DN1548_c0_g1_i5.p3  ORF type:complete len:270 (+),score=82.31 TRINITY_DN1548_c0_g1_i5:790-1599(+)
MPEARPASGEVADAVLRMVASAATCQRRPAPAAAAPTPAGPCPRPDGMKELWSRMSGRRVVGFYGHSAGKPHACFSNFALAPHHFSVPAPLWKEDFPGHLREVRVRWSEQSIMLCKALVMGDVGTAERILRAKTPMEAKKLGRAVSHWDQGRWDDNVCLIARECVWQKFSQCADLQPELLGTGDAIICEATRNDCIWGIGIDLGDDRMHNTRQWRGTNILGWALMEARDRLAGAAPAAETATAAPAAGARASPAAGPARAAPAAKKRRQ